MRMFKKTALALVVGTAVLAIGAAQAKVSADKAAQLGTTLTPLGGEKAGNAAGTIPAWTGGITTPPAGYKPGQHHPDPFAADQPLFTVTAANAAQYAAQLTAGRSWLAPSPRAMVTVSASTSVRPSAAAEVSRPAWPNHACAASTM